MIMCMLEDVMKKTHYNTRHGLTKTKVHACWRQMKYRCTTTTSSLYKKYGAKGIRVCKRWEKFENFLEDMGLPPTKNHSIDRKNGMRGYSKSNCRWATSKEQMANVRSNKFYTYNNEKLHEREWARRIGINRSTLRGRFRQGWSIEKALSTPPRSYS